jgi:hypothetical protein
MIKIYKYEKPIKDKIKFKLPNANRIIKFGSRKINHLTIWALVEPDSIPEIEKTFIIKGTGFDIDLNPYIMYVDTIFDFDGFHVWHIFEEKNELS